MALNDKQQRFCDEYLIDLNATQAAIRAGYSEKTAKSIGHENLTKPDVIAYLSERQKEREIRTQITQDNVLRDIDKIKADAMTKISDREGNLSMNNHPAALKACELLGKHLGMFKDRVEMTGADGGPLNLSLEVAFIGADRAT